MQSEFEDPRARLGRAVREAREQMGLSQEELADRSALNRTYVGSVERGERNISLLNIHKLAAALEISPGKLIDG